jgi:hypothetical protein
MVSFCLKEFSLFTYPWIGLSGQDQVLCDAVFNDNLDLERKGKRKRPENDKGFLKSEISLLCGTRGEIAVSRYFNLRWHIGELKESGKKLTNQDFYGSDLEFGVEAKATDYPNGGLFVSGKTHADYMQASPNTPVVLALVDAWPFVEIPGFMFAKEIPNYPFNKTKAGHNSGFLVPVNKLRKVEEFIKLLDHWRNFSQ